MVLLHALCLAQGFSVTDRVEPSEIRIGEPATVRFEVVQDQDARVAFPAPVDTLCRGVELLAPPSFDTVRLDDGRIQVSMECRVSAYDSGFFFIPEMAFASADARLNSRPLGLTVHTVELDEESPELRPAKNIMKSPFSWSEFFMWVGISLGVCLIVALAAALVLKYGFRKNVTLLPVRETPPEPPYEVAMRRLQALRDAKAWRTGDVKLFYTQLSDTVRAYLSDRFALNAMESTSAEILDMMRRVPEATPVIPQLKDLLDMADLVKFAKYLPLEDDTQRQLSGAFDIVETTKPVVFQADPDASAPAGDAEEERRKS